MNTSGIEPHLTRAERMLVDTLGLREKQLHAHLASAQGLWKDAPVTIATRAYEGDAIEYLRVAYVAGSQLAIGNLLAQGRPNRALPILGADLVWLGAHRATMIAADLSSMLDGAAKEEEHRRLAAALPDVSTLPAGGELPAWCRAWFSPSALYTRVDAELLEPALEAFDRYVDAFVTLAGASPRADIDPDAIRARHRGYADAHRTDDKGLGLLGTMFGKAWAEEYVHGVLFPEL